jgi:hypothetical protein
MRSLLVSLGDLARGRKTWDITCAISKRSYSSELLGCSTLSAWLLACVDARRHIVTMRHKKGMHIVDSLFWHLAVFLASYEVVSVEPSSALSLRAQPNLASYEVGSVELALSLHA